MNKNILFIIMASASISMHASQYSDPHGWHLAMMQEQDEDTMPSYPISAPRQRDPHGEHLAKMQELQRLEEEEKEQQESKSSSNPLKPSDNVTRDANGKIMQVIYTNESGYSFDMGCPSPRTYAKLEALTKIQQSTDVTKSVSALAKQ